MFAVGHMALGYLTGKLINKTTKQNLNLPAIWTLSLLPDIDLLIPGLRHRGPTHSLIIAILIFIPLLIAKGRETAPYFAVLATHTLIADCITNGGAQILWPLSKQWIEYQNTIIMGTIIETNIELIFFMTIIGTLTISKDYKHLLNSDRRNTLLFIPLCTILLPVMFRYPLTVPKTLVIPHLIVLSIATISFLMSLLRPTTMATEDRPQTLKL